MRCAISESPHAAKPQKTSTADAESRWLPRKPAHIKGSKMRNPSMISIGKYLSEFTTNCRTVGGHANCARPRQRWQLLPLRSIWKTTRGIAQSKMTGAMITIPAASMSHHFAQVPIETTTGRQNQSIGKNARPAMAMPELIIAVGAKAMSPNFAMLSGDASRLVTCDPMIDQPSSSERCDRGRDRIEADSKSVVGPEEMAVAKIDPMRIAGQTRLPRSKIRLSATPSRRPQWC